MLAILAVVALIGLRLVDVPFAAAIVTTAGSAIVLGFLLVPLAFGVDDTLDPRAFSLVGMPTSRLAAGLALSALVGVPALVISVISIAQVVTWSRTPFAVVIALVSAIFIVVTCVLGARVTTSLAAFLLATRRSREVTGLIAILAIVSVAPALAIFASTTDWSRNGLKILGSLASVLGWTPLGAAWAAPAAAAAGDSGGAILRLLVAVASCGILWLAWRALVERMLVTPERVSRERAHTGLGWFGRMPDTPTGAVAGRSVTYWVRDARYHTALVAIPVAPVIFVIAFGIAGVPWHVLALVPVPAMCLFLSWSVHNDIAYDNTAIWLHVASNTSGIADRFGRIVPALILGVPLIAIGGPISVALYGDYSVLPSMLGVSACILLAGLGLSSIVSVRFPYPAVRPGDSPFAQPQASGSAAGLVQSLSFFATIIVALVPIALAALGFAFGFGWHIAAFVAGVAIGLAGLRLGVLWGARIYAARAPELLAFTLRN